MSKRLDRIYMDSCIAIEMAKCLLGIHRHDRENDLWFVRKMLMAVEDGKIEIMTSSLTVAETLHLGQDDMKNTIECPPSVQEFLVRLLTSGTLVTLVEPSLLLAEEARDLRWKHGLKLRPMDSMHVASALLSQCGEMITWDKEMNEKRAAEVEILARRGLKIIPPHKSDLLPPDYRQDGLQLESPQAQKQLPPPPIQ